MENINEIYPYIDYPTPIEKPIERASEYAYDIERHEFLLDENGENYLVYENEAIKIKIWKLFMTEKYKEVIFPWTYGHELLSLIGKSYTQGYINSEAERFIKEAIFKNLDTYVERLEDIKIFFMDGTLYCDFEVITIYGSLRINGLKVIDFESI